MCKTGIRLFIFLWVLCLPIKCLAEGFPTLQSLESFRAGDWTIQPSLKVGYQYMTVNMNLPVPFTEFAFELATASGLDFSLKNAGVWIGGVGLNMRRGTISLFVDAEGNASKSVRVSTPSDPFWAGMNPVEWRGSRLEWWNVGGGGSFNFHDNAALMGGFKVEHLSLQLSDAVDPTGVIQQFQVLYGDRYSGDLRSKLWTPYIGLKLESSYSKAALLFSPYTWADVRIPFRYLFINIPGISYAYEEALYSFKRGGILLEGHFDYRFQAFTNANCALWLKGTWCRIRGGGSEDYHADAIGFPGPIPSVGSHSVGTFTSQALAGGFSLFYAF